MSICLNDTNGDGDCAACARNPEAPCRVSAREALIRSVYYKLSQNQMERLVDAYAHGLAEKIRAHKGALNGKEWHDFAADLIDPEADTR